jgi:hypothetical protein
MAAAANRWFKPHEWDVAAFGHLTNLRGRNLRGLRKVELLQRFHSRQLRVPRPVLNRMPVSLFAFQSRQRLQVICLAACRQKRRVRFTTAAVLVKELVEPD